MSLSKLAFKTVSISWKLLNFLRRSLFLVILIASLLFNAALLLSDTLFLLASGAIGAVTGVRSLVVRQADDIAKQSAESVAERQVAREVRSEMAEKTAQLASERRVSREVRSELAETTMQLSTARAARNQVREAAETTAKRIAQRTKRGAIREIASMPAEAIPFWGTAIIVGATGLEIADMCATVTDMTDLQRLFDPDIAVPDEQLTVCSLQVPSRGEIWEMARNAPSQVWDSAKNAMPTSEEVQNFELPRVDWSNLGASIADTSSSWADTAGDAVGSKWGQIKHWWN